MPLNFNKDRLSEILVTPLTDTRKLWFCTAPITREFLKNIYQFQIKTYSCENPPPDSQSWVDVSIWRHSWPPDGNYLPADRPSKLFPPPWHQQIRARPENGEACRWQSHHHWVLQKPQWRFGDIFHKGHSLWKYLEIGDMIGIEAFNDRGEECEGWGLEIVTWADRNSHEEGMSSPQDGDANSGYRDPSDIFGCLEGGGIDRWESDGETHYWISCIGPLESSVDSTGSAS
jgi:hypothetical protein